MNKHETVDKTGLNPPSFLVGSAASGLWLTYAATAHLDEVLAAGPGSFAPSVWYRIGKDGKVEVTVGKADMGQHIASTMAQLVAEELEASWKDMTIAFASN